MLEAMSSGKLQGWSRNIHDGSRDPGAGFTRYAHDDIWSKEACGKTCTCMRILELAHGCIMLGRQQSNRVDKPKRQSSKSE